MDTHLATNGVIIIVVVVIVLMLGGWHLIVTAKCGSLHAEPARACVDAVGNHNDQSSADEHFGDHHLPVLHHRHRLPHPLFGPHSSSAILPPLALASHP